MQTSPFWGGQLRCLTGSPSRSGVDSGGLCVCVFYLINVGVPHLGEKTERWWRVRIVDGELDPSLEKGTKMRV